MTRRQMLALTAAAGVTLTACDRVESADKTPARNGYGYINASGEWVTDPIYRYAFTFAEGRGVVTRKDGDRNLVGLVGSDGALVADPLEARPQVSGLSQGFLLAMSTDYSMGFIDASGAWGIIQSGSGEDFSRDDSFSPADAFSDEPYALALSARWNKWGAIDADGEWLVSPEFDDVVHSYSGVRPETGVGLLPMSLGTGESARWGFVDSTGAWAIDYDFSDVSWFHGDVAYARDPDGGLMGTVDSSGAWVIQPEFASISFAGGSAGPILARDAESSLWGTANASGWVATPSWRSVGISGATEELLVLDDATGLWGVASREGEWVVAPVWPEVDERAGIVGGLVVAKDSASGLWGVASAADGSWSTGASFSGLSADAALSFPMAACDSESGLWGYVAADGSWTIEPAFGFAAPFSEGLAVAAEEGVWDEDEPIRIVTHVDGTPVPKTEDLPTNRLLTYDKDLDLVDYQKS